MGEFDSQIMGPHSATDLVLGSLFCKCTHLVANLCLDVEKRFVTNEIVQIDDVFWGRSLYKIGSTLGLWVTL
jgi:hypothetical protein